MALLLGLVFAGFYGFDRFRAKAVHEFLTKMTHPTTPVVVDEATLQAVPQFVRGIGVLSAVRQVTIAPVVAGRITEIEFESGARVQTGDLLIQIDDAPEQGDLAYYRAQAKLAAQNLSRSRQLLAQSYTAKATLDQDQAQLEQAQASIEKTQALIDEKHIRAPFSGVLGIRQVNLGQYVSPGASIVTLTDLSQLYVDFTLPEKTRSQVAVGQHVQLSVDAYPDRTFDARVTTIEPQIDPGTHTIKLQGTLANPGERLQPGMFAMAAVELPPQPNVITVPETAVAYSLYGDTVYVVRETPTSDGQKKLTVSRKVVRTGQRFNGRVTILKGLEAGDRVVVSGQLRLFDGAPVKLSSDRSLTLPAAVPLN